MPILKHKKMISLEYYDPRFCLFSTHTANTRHRPSVVIMRSIVSKSGVCRGFVFPLFTPIRNIHSKHETLIQSCLNVGPPSTTVDQHSNNIDSVNDSRLLCSVRVRGSCGTGEHQYVFHADGGWGLHVVGHGGSAGTACRTRAAGTQRLRTASISIWNTRNRK